MAGEVKISYLRFAEKVLTKVETALSYQEIWDKGKELGLGVKGEGKTPNYALAAYLYPDSLEEESKFGREGVWPVRFYLKSNPPKSHVSAEDMGKTSAPAWYHESDLHQILAHFAFANPKFGRGKNIRTKTIVHQKGQNRKGFSEWTFPDMVGVWLPDWSEALVEFGKKISGDLPLLFSFELKKEITPSNYREAFFQAVSNSSWANEGYLVAAEVAENDQMRAELRRLSTSFRVGVIRLDVENPIDSEVLYPATAKERLDWETMNKLCDESDDFCGFLKRVKKDFDSGQGAAEYDEIKEEEDIKALFDQKRKKAKGTPVRQKRVKKG